MPKHLIWYRETNIYAGIQGSKSSSHYNKTNATSARIPPRSMNLDDELAMSRFEKMNEWYPGCTICTNTNECTISTTTEHEAGEWWHFNECCFDLRAWISFSKVFEKGFLECNVLLHCYLFLLGDGISINAVGVFLVNFGLKCKVMFCCGFTELWHFNECWRIHEAVLMQFCLQCRF